MPATAFAHDVDPKAKLIEAVGDVTDVEVFHNQVLCAVYIAPEKTRGGIIRPPSNIEEDRYQGKLGLILKCGPRAFESDTKWTWPEDMGEGDWVFYRVSDTIACTINGQSCRLIDDIDVKGRVQQPDRVW
jgi:co-chaperonin GroES (HSP10)